MKKEPKGEKMKKATFKISAWDEKRHCDDKYCSQKIKIRYISLAVLASNAKEAIKRAKVLIKRQKYWIDRIYDSGT